jgi:hypothetical protein
VTGKDFSFPLEVFVGGLRCEILEFTRSVIYCTLSASNGFNRTVFVNSMEEFSKTLSILSYKRPTIDAIRGCLPSVDNSSVINCDRAGTSRLTIVGSNFGSKNAMVLVGVKYCINITHDPLTPHEVVYCVAPANNAQGAPLLLIQSGGELSSNDKTVSYRQCKPGYFEASDALNCLPCDGGSYSVLDGQTTCIDCGVGMFNAALNSTSCSPCPAGRFQNTTGKTFCYTCEKGTFAISPGQFVSFLLFSACLFSSLISL